MLCKELVLKDNEIAALALGELQAAKTDLSDKYKALVAAKDPSKSSDSVYKLALEEVYFCVLKLRQLLL